MKSYDFDVVIIGGGIVGTTLAAGLSKRGFKTVIIERGLSVLEDKIEATPPIYYLKKIHMGSSVARNHILGGNGHYWGGGVIRPPMLSIDSCLGIENKIFSSQENIEENFKNIESELCIPNPLPRKSFFDRGLTNVSGFISEIYVIPGKSRNVATFYLKKYLKYPESEIIDNAIIQSFDINQVNDSGLEISAIKVKYNKEIRNIKARDFVLAAGTVDTNLLLLEHSKVLQLDIESEGLGSRLHDHLSVPLAKIKLPVNFNGQALLAPRFHSGLIVGSHFELVSKVGWGGNGFLHFTYDFDNVSPYREIKNILLLRQQNGNIFDLVSSSLALLKQFPEMAKIAFNRYIKKRLYLSPHLNITATLDFETYPHPHNSFFLRDQKFELNWEISSEDETCFIDLLSQSRNLLDNFKENIFIEVEPLANFLDVKETIAYLHKAAIDTYHLGGGIHSGSVGDALVDENLRFNRIQNLYAISSAVFNRAGVVNPTHTLMALANRFIEKYHQKD